MHESSSAVHQHLSYFGFVFYFSHFNKYVVVSHYSFYSCFPNILIFQIFMSYSCFSGHMISYLYSLIHSKNTIDASHTSNISITWKPLKNTKFQIPPRLTKSEPGNGMNFKKSSQWFSCMPQFGHTHQWASLSTLNLKDRIQLQCTNPTLRFRTRCCWCLTGL